MSTGAKLKEKEAKKLYSLVKEANIAVCDTQDIDAYTLQKLRKEAKENNWSVVFTKKVVIERALLNVSPELSKFASECKHPFLIIGQFSASDLSKLIDKFYVRKAPKEGEVAEFDIVIPAGPTTFPPGPMTTMFTSLGIKTKSEGGKISIAQDTVVVKKGNVVSEQVANLLRILGIRPITIHLRILGAKIGNLIIRSELFAINSEYLRKAIAEAYSTALSLAVYKEIPEKEAISRIIQKVYIQAKYLMIFKEIVSAETVGAILLKAVNAAKALGKGNMDYIYAALLLHSLGKPIDEESLKNVIRATGAEVDEAKVKVIVDALKGVDIDKAITEAQQASVAAPVAVAAQPAAASTQQKQEEKEKEDKKAEEEAAAGLSSLFG
jgi:large subunit ribosomal protein L10